jgi:(5-formylfuran-3-yl)methyl phosphate synthase
MRLLVSVRNAAEAAAAVAGGADIVDAKEPSNGALGPVSAAALASIASAVAGAAPVSAALGEICRDDIAGGVNAATRAHAAFVKIGFAGMRGRLDAAADLLSAAVSTSAAGLVLVAYADYDKIGAPSPDEVIALAEHSGAAGVLLDTCDKCGPRLTRLMTSGSLRTFVARARAAGRTVAVAGSLAIEDLENVHDAGAEIAGVRGAACENGRNGVVSESRVRALRRALRRD